jgi:hypothetical protein
MKLHVRMHVRVRAKLACASLVCGKGFRFYLLHRRLTFDDLNDGVWVVVVVVVVVVVNQKHTP